MPEDTKLDLLMSLLEEQEGWASYRETVLAKQQDALKKIMHAPSLGTNLEHLYAQIAEFNAFARVLGIPGELGQKAIAARKAEAEGKTTGTLISNARPSATARARKAANA